MLAPEQADHALQQEEGATQARAAPRFQLMLRQARLIGDSGEYLGLLRDISATGARVQFFHPVPARRRIALEIRQDLVVNMERRWESESTGGYQFDAPIDVESAVMTAGPHPKRSPRLGLERPLVVSAAGNDVPARLFNISQEGACIECEFGLARFQLVKLTIDGLGQRHAKVRWRRGPRYGLVLEDRFDLREFACLVAAQAEE